MADKYGRKLVALLGLCGVILGLTYLFIVLEADNMFPFNAIYAFPIFFLIGGGPAVIGALFMAIIADITPKEILSAGCPFFASCPQC
jgi:MFS family permease